MGFMDKLKAGAEQLKDASGQAAQRAKLEMEELKVKRELGGELDAFGQRAYELAESGAISHADLTPGLERIRKLKADLDDLAKREAAIGDEPAEPAEPAATPDEQQPPA